MTKKIKSQTKKKMNSHPLPKITPSSKALPSVFALLLSCANLQAIFQPWKIKDKRILSVQMFTIQLISYEIFFFSFWCFSEQTLRSFTSSWHILKFRSVRMRQSSNFLNCDAHGFRAIIAAISSDDESAAVGCALLFVDITGFDFSDFSASKTFQNKYYW